MEPTLVLQLALALGLGLLVGLERERSSEMVGIRTMPLVTLFGTLAGLLTPAVGPWMVPASLLGLVALLLLENRMRNRHEPAGPTTEVAALVMFSVGACLALYRVDVAIVTTGVVMLLLHGRRQLHAFASELHGGELRSIARFVLIALIVLPLLPDRAYGPYGVLNPFQIWLMVVLIVGISLAGYVAQRWLGTRVGTYLSGVLGGLISSTATTVSFARRAQRQLVTPRAAALVILLASIVVFLRVFIEIGIVTPDHLGVLVPPLLAMMLWMAAIVGAFVLFRPLEAVGTEAPRDPSDLRAAIVFGLLYAAVLLLVAFARERFGASGLYVVAVLSGLTDVDAITLSTSQMMRADEFESSVAWRMILLGALANLFFKFVLASVMGGRALLRELALPIAVSFAGGIALFFLWPADWFLV